MAKQSGTGSSLWVGAYDLSGDIGAITSASHSRVALSTTSIADLGESRILARHDGSLAFSSYWNTVTGRAHPVLSALPTTDVIASIVVGAGAVGGPAASIVGKQADYAPTFGADGSLVATTNIMANGSPLEWGELLTTGLQTFASGSLNGTSTDLGATDTAFGAAAYLHVISLGSGNPTVTVADSANNTDFAALSPTSLAFTPVAASVERKVTGLTATVRRYVRVQVTGTYTALVCGLVFVRYTEAAV
jgi:hypothetical protein